MLKARKADLSGILNGIDTAFWDPKADTALPEIYSARSLAKNTVNKRALLAWFGLDEGVTGPLFSVISRLSKQKGVDMALEALPCVLDRGARFVMLGAGDPQLEDRHRDLAACNPEQVGVEFGFDEDRAHLIQAGADATLAPSRLEPCGPTQLCAMRCGAPPVVSKTGGLADTVIDGSDAAVTAGCATGFKFAPATLEKLGEALDRAMALYADKTAWRRIVLNAMKRPVGWDRAALRLADLYRALKG